jgi:hypothetical protein
LKPVSKADRLHRGTKRYSRASGYQSLSVQR